ncbi:unnamed protein product [Vitrella brassicaformis CCMP3155]|uniref:Alpha-glucosidase n=2 Tax=Vitrella brassicaformis TaxID=1169539 RepID=A0A0G4GLT5_VITBC|nr:unnamed protein product [Vitrella brassicaformis CCMP3155]|eukprot:CEM31079.1 unnamed protein product [Vitrella brassicaformis CCMP3155]
MVLEGIRLGENVEIEALDETEVNDVIETRGGKHSRAKNNFVEAVYKIRQVGSDFKWHLDVRVFSDGVAIRYRVPGAENGTFTETKVLGELTEFSLTLGDDDVTWTFSRPNNPKSELGNYEGIWEGVKFRDLPTRNRFHGSLYGLPVVLSDATKKAPFPYRLITDAALYSYSGMRLRAGDTGVLKVDLADKMFKKALPFKTPWRVLMLAGSLNDLVNSDLVPNLNPPPDLQLFNDTSYIKAGRSVWRWLKHNTGTPEEERHYIDMAQQLGYEYTTIDEGWESRKAGHSLMRDMAVQAVYDKFGTHYWKEVERLIEYAEDKGLKVFLWKNHGQVADPSNDYEDLRTFLDKVKHVGAAGVKGKQKSRHGVGLSEAIDKIELQEKILIEGAKRRLMINFHGCAQPSGQERTYPNAVTREGIMGLETNRFGSNPKLMPSHNAALPFTRFIVGPADYTPLSLDEKYKGPTTTAHQIATLICFDSYLQTISEDPQVIMESPFVDVIKKIPSTWDETRVLEPSAIGELAVIVRRKDDEWFLGVLSGSTETREVKISLDFLEDKEYTATIVMTKLLESDGHENTVMEEHEWFASAEIEVKLWGEDTKGDGYVMILSPPIDDRRRTMRQESVASWVSDDR